MNRRRFSGAVLGAGSLLISGFAFQSVSAFARTKTDDEDSDRTATSTDDDGAAILEHVVSSWQRSYESEDPVTYVTAVAVELDKKRNAADAFDYMRQGGVDSFEDFEIDDEGEFGDLTDQGYIYYGVTGSGASEVNVALLYVQQGTMVYAIVSAGVEDQVEVVGDFYDTLFDEAREEVDVLLTEDEMPRGFVMTEDAGGDASDEDVGDDPTPEPTEEDKPRKRR